MGCGARAPQPELWRVTSRQDGALEIVGGSPPVGRSGYLHPSPECWQQFARRKGAVRSLGRSVDKPQRIALVQTLNRFAPTAKMR